MKNQRESCQSDRTKNMLSQHLFVCQRDQRCVCNTEGPTNLMSTPAQVAQGDPARMYTEKPKKSLNPNEVGHSEVELPLGHLKNHEPEVKMAAERSRSNQCRGIGREQTAWYIQCRFLYLRALIDEGLPQPLPQQCSCGSHLG